MLSESIADHDAGCVSQLAIHGPGSKTLCKVAAIKQLSLVRARAKATASIAYYDATNGSMGPPEGPSTVFWVAVVACTVVIRPSTIPKLSFSTCRKGQPLTPAHEC